MYVASPWIRKKADAKAPALVSFYIILQLLLLHNRPDFSAPPRAIRSFVCIVHIGELAQFVPVGELAGDDAISGVLRFNDGIITDEQPHMMLGSVAVDQKDRGARTEWDAALQRDLARVTYIPQELLLW